jgi:predicted aspartyl protease
VVKYVRQEEDDCSLPSGSPILSPVLANIFCIYSTAVKDRAIEEGSIDGNYLIVTCTLSLNTKEIPTHSLIDGGATSYVFMDQDFANHYNLPLFPVKSPRALEVIDAQKISSGNITDIAKAYLSIDEYHDRLPMFVTKLCHYPIVLGILWLKQHDIAIRFMSNLVTFSSQYCPAHSNHTVVTV